MGTRHAVRLIADVGKPHGWTLGRHAGPAKLAYLIIQFFLYIKPKIDEFEQAVEKFKERVSGLTEVLAKQNRRSACG